MPPKKGSKKKKDPELQEPDHDGSWEKAVESGVWELPPTSLPDANTWPSWGALRERILTATKKISIVGSAAVRDAFLAELVKLSPPELHTLELRGSSSVSKAVISPTTACPKLAHLDLYGCPKLEHVLIQSQSLLTLNLTNCTGLKKAFIQCPHLEKLESQGCVGLEVIMLWSDKLVELDLTDSKEMTTRELHCPNLQVQKVASLLAPPRPVKPTHPPIADIIRDQIHEAAEQKAQQEQDFKNSAETKTTIPAMWRPIA